ncbi:MAG: hypothetical protein RR656_00435 [Cetobacterium sp.]
MSRKRIFLVIFPLIFGVLIYMLFRSKNLLYFKLLNHLSLDTPILEIRKYTKLIRPAIPNWVIYSLPDGIWLFSMGSAMLLHRIFFPGIQLIYTGIYVVMVIIEVIQFYFGGHGTLLGTFDLMDLLCFSVGYILASFLGYYFWKKNDSNEYYKYKYEKYVLKITDYHLKDIKYAETLNTIFLVIIFSIIGFLPSLVKFS